MRTNPLPCILVDPRHDGGWRLVANSIPQGAAGADCREELLVAAEALQHRQPPLGRNLGNEIEERDPGVNDVAEGLGCRGQLLQLLYLLDDIQEVLLLSCELPARVGRGCFDHVEIGGEARRSHGVGRGRPEHALDGDRPHAVRAHQSL